MFALILAALLLFPVQVFAWGDVGALSGANSTSTGTTLAWSPSATLNAGNVGICLVVFDNTTSADSQVANESSAFSDSAGNTWTKLGEFINAQGGAGAGVGTAIWATKATTQVTTGDTITATFANSIVSKAVNCREFTITSGKEFSLAATSVLASDGVTDPPSIAISGLSSAARLWLRTMAAESDSLASHTPTSGYTGTGLATADAGPAGDSVTSRAEFIIATATGHTSDPTWTTGAADMAALFIALDEVDPATNRSGMTLGVGR